MIKVPEKLVHFFDGPGLYDPGKYLKGFSSKKSYDWSSVPSDSVLRWIRPNGYFWGYTTGSLSASTSITSNTLYANNFILCRPATFLSIGIYVYTSGSGYARLGIYKDNGFYPGELLVDAGTVNVSTAGAKEIAISVSVQPGIYWLALVSNVAHNLYYSNSLQISCLGSTAPGATLTYNYTGYTVSYTYGAMPITFPSGGSVYEYQIMAIKVN